MISHISNSKHFTMYNNNVIIHVADYNQHNQIHKVGVQHGNGELLFIKIYSF